MQVAIVDKPTLQALFGQPPRRAIEYLQQKQVMPSEDWWRVLGDAHNKSFVIAHMTQLDLLEDIRKSLIDAQKKGMNLKQWSEIAEEKMKARGWWGKQQIQTEAGTREVQLGNAYRLRTIYQTNMAQAYEAGRQSVMWSEDKLFPYVQYSAILDNRTRPRHRALHGIVMRKSDPAWQYIAPKNGYNCRCTVIELMDGEVEGQKIKVYDSGKYLQVYDVDVGNGGISKVARLDFPDRPSFQTDAGWVGRPNANLTQQLLDKALVAEPKIASTVVQQTFSKKTVLNSYNQETKGWINSFGSNASKNDFRPVGVLEPKIINALANKGFDPKSAVITLRQDVKIEAAESWIENIVEHLQQPYSLYLHRDQTDMMIAFDSNSKRSKQKIMLQLVQDAKLGHLIRSVSLQSLDELDTDYELVIKK